MTAAGTDGVNFSIDLNALDIVCGPLRFLRNHCQSGIEPLVIEADDGKGKAVVLAVRSGAWPLPNPDDMDDLNYERCELREAKENPTTLGTHSFYGFSLRVPDTFPNLPLRCVVAQVKMPYDKSGNPSPAFALRIDNRQYVATVEHLYEPDAEDPIDSTYLTNPLPDGFCRAGAVPAQDHSDFVTKPDDYSMQVRAILATGAAGLPDHLRRCDFKRCTTGVKVATHGFLPDVDGRWADFIVEIAPTGKKNCDGAIRLYVDGSLIAEATGEFGFPFTPKPALQYFKIGPYRDLDSSWGTETAFIEVRNLRRGSSLVDVLPPVLVAAL